MGDKSKGLPTPPEIRAHLDEYVIGQEDAKRVLSVALYNHYKRVGTIGQDTGGVELSKSNILMVGPTGTGKTYIVSTLARMLDVPYYAADATALLGTGIREIENFLTQLVAVSNNDIKRAERGILFLDEVDKLASRYNKSSESIQQALLKTIEGTAATVIVNGARKVLNTHNILFVVGGAFVGLDQVINDRVDGGMIGITVTTTQLIKQVVPDDFARYGLIPEFLGRLPVTVALEAMTIPALIDILTKPKNNLVAQFTQMFKMDGIELTFTDEALEKIAHKALSLNTGARSLRTVIEECLRDVMYVAPGEKSLNKVVVTGDAVLKKEQATLVYVHGDEDKELVPITPRRQRDTAGALDL